MAKEVVEFKKYGIFVKSHGENVLTSFINSGGTIMIRSENTLRGSIEEMCVSEDQLRKHQVSADDFITEVNAYFKENNNLVNQLYQKTKDFVYDKIKNCVLKNPYEGSVYFCYDDRIRVGKNAIVYFDTESKYDPVFFIINEDEFNNLIASNKWLKK